MAFYKLIPQHSLCIGPKYDRTFLPWPIQIHSIYFAYRNIFITKPFSTCCICILSNQHFSGQYRISTMKTVLRPPEINTFNYNLDNGFKGFLYHQCIYAWYVHYQCDDKSNLHISYTYWNIVDLCYIPYTNHFSMANCMHYKLYKSTIMTMNFHPNCRYP